MPNTMGNLMLWIQRNKSEFEPVYGQSPQPTSTDREPFILNLERIPIPVLMVNKQGVIIRTNRAFQDFYGLNSMELRGSNFLTMFEELTMQDYIRVFEQVQHHPHIQRDGVITTNFGEVKWVHLHFNRLDFEQQDTILLTVSDVSSVRNQAEKLSRDYQEIKLLADSVSDAIYVVNQQGCIEWQNQVARSFLGYKDHQIIGHSVSSILPEFRNRREKSPRKDKSELSLHMEGIHHQDAYVVTKQHEKMPVRVWIRRKRLGNRFIQVILIRDQRSELEQEIDFKEIREHFQREVAQDLHDSIGGFLTGITMIGEQVLRQMKQVGNPISQGVEELVSLIREADEQTHLLAKGLLREGQVQNGLNKALEKLCIRISKLFHVTCSYCGIERIDLLSENIASQLYSIAQEAIGNSIRHGRADQIQVTVEICHGALQLNIEDNGSGIVTNNGHSNGKQIETGGRTSNVSRKHAGGLGLQIMKRRADQLGGQFSLSRTQGQKTLAKCTVPLDRLTWNYTQELSSEKDVVSAPEPLTAQGPSYVDTLSTETVIQEKP